MGDRSNKLTTRPPYIYRRLPTVYSRDFAYANSVTIVLRMARANVADLSAKSFAEYVAICISLIASSESFVCHVFLGQRRTRVLVVG